MSTLRAHPLRHTLHFTEDELALNREGRLSERQVNRLVEEDRKTRRTMQRIAAGLAAVGGVVLFFQEAGMAFIVFLMAAGVYFAARRFAKPGADVQAQRCRAVEGHVKLVRTRDTPKEAGTPSWNYWLQVHATSPKSEKPGCSAPASNKQFQISKRAWEAFMEDMVYRVYYADTNVVSAEPK